MYILYSHLPFDFSLSDEGVGSEEEEVDESKEVNCESHDEEVAIPDATSKSTNLLTGQMVSMDKDKV